MRINYETSQNISLRHVNEAFNEELRADYTVVTIRSENYHILHVMDMEAGHEERVIKNTHEAKALERRLEINWILHHEAPQSSVRNRNYVIRYFKSFSIVIESN